VTRFVLPAAIGFLIGFGAIAAIDAVVEPDPAPTRVDAEVLVDATVVEMHGSGPDGEAGVWTYDCSSQKGKLVCTQREP
jgi:hypothetical protein